MFYVRVGDRGSGIGDRGSGIGDRGSGIGDRVGGGQGRGVRSRRPSRSDGQGHELSLGSKPGQQRQIDVPRLAWFSPAQHGSPQDEDDYARLREIGQRAVSALERGLTDPDVGLRRNVARFLIVGGMGLWSPREPRFDLRRLVPALTVALSDSDPTARGFAAQAIGTAGAAAAPAVPALIALLSNTDEGSRNSACIGLAGIGPAAKEALPALRRALSDSSISVRGFAQRAIETIQGAQ